MSDLTELLERVKAATGPDRHLDAMVEVEARRQIAYAVGLNDEQRAWWKATVDGVVYDSATSYAADRHTASIDASLALVGRVLPGWVVADLSQNSRHAGDPWGCKLALYAGADPSKNRAAFSGYDFPTAPLAILSALLSALIAQGASS